MLVGTFCVLIKLLPFAGTTLDIKSDYYCAGHYSANRFSAAEEAKILCGFDYNAPKQQT